MNDINAAGNQLKTHSRVFDALNRLYQDIGAVNQTTTYAYDANGNLTGVTDPLNRQTTRSYDALNRLIGSTDAANGNTQRRTSGSRTSGSGLAITHITLLHCSNGATPQN